MTKEAIKPLNHIDIVLSVYNQENLIERVLFGIFKNTTTPFTLIMVFDGCTDRTEKRALCYIRKHAPRTLTKFISEKAPNVYETRANNIGFKKAQSDFMITLQDDMAIKEYGWERRLTYPLRKYNDVLAVTSRSTHNIASFDEKNGLVYADKKGREYGTLPRDIFAMRDIINRGPIAFNMNHLRAMNYLNEDYAPSDLDDADLSLRAWKTRKLKVGAYWIDYSSPLHWGKTRAKDTTMQSDSLFSRNMRRIYNDHKDYIESGIKHNEEILIPEKEIDYTTLEPYTIPAWIHCRIRIHKKGIKRFFTEIPKNTKNLLTALLESIGVKGIREKGFRKFLQN